MLVLVVTVFSDASFLFLSAPSEAEAAQVTIDSAVNAANTSHIRANSQTVFVSDQVGYRFYRDGTNTCVYSKTTDGGANWGLAVTVDAQTDCIGIGVWYEPWTPGRTASYIHIVTYDTSADDPFYNRLDTSGDTLLLGTAPVSVVTGSGQGGTLAVGANAATISVGTDGTVYVALSDASDSYVVECSTSCNTNTNWTEVGTNPLDLANDYNLLAPLSNGDMLLINRDVSADDIRSKIWSNSGGSWSGTWTTIDAAASDNTTYDVGMALSVSSTTPGVVYLAYVADNVTLGTNDDVRTATYSGSSWAVATDVITNTTRGLTDVAIGIDAATDDIYVAYSAQSTAGTANTGNVYWKRSTDGMSSWGAENGPVNTTADDISGVNLNTASDQRLFVSWFDNTDDAIYGDTIADVFPGVHASTTGTQVSVLRASTTDRYIGGAFVLSENYKSNDVTGITVTESGSIDGFSGIGNVKLFYEMDTSAPYDCASVSYGGTESQFGSTDTNGFSGADGTSAFTGTTVTVSTTSTMCVYPVMDILDEAVSSSTIELSIADPSADITVTNSTAGPSIAQAIGGTTTVVNDVPTLTHFHFRNDDNTEDTATSRTGGVVDTNLTALTQTTPTRIRFQISNEGSTSTPAMQYRLEYSTTTGSCSAATNWIDAGAIDDDINLYDSTQLVDGNDTTNIAEGIGGMADENTTFKTPNGGIKDTSSQTGSITLSPYEFVELEYAFVASTTATEGNTYCFRVTDAGSELSQYDVLPRATIASDIFVTATSSQYATTTIPDTGFHIGGAYVLTDNTGSHTVTGITLSENGTVDAQNDLDNILIRYDLDTTAPYDCSSESYAGSETQFGSTDTDGFSSENGTSTFSGSVSLSTTATMCAYVIADVRSTAQNGETINVLISNPAVDVTAGSGSVGPTINRDIASSTTLMGAILTQTHYHFRNDNGAEGAATSMTGGVDDTAITGLAQNTQVRVRMQVSNEGSETSPDVRLRLEYGLKITTCDAIASWTDVGTSGGAWDMYASTGFVEGDDTINIAEGIGGMADENTTFKTPNAALKDTSSQIATTTFTASEFMEAEFSVKQTADAAYDATYCFRLSDAGTPLNAYTTYPEVTTSPERDFEIQRGTLTVSGTSGTITAGVDYIAPASTSTAFIRITNTQHTGAGDNSLGGTQNADDVTAYISNPGNLLTSITFTRPSTAISNTRVSWEIIEFIGTPGSDNEMKVRDASSVTYGTTALVATGTAATVSDDSDVVVFITGQFSPDTAATDYNTVQSVSSWNGTNNQPVFQRGEASSDAVRTSYAVVEFTGVNWKIQRVAHTYTAAGVTETESITPVNSLSRAFIHTQKTAGTALQGTDEFGAEVWLSSIGQASFFLESGATTPSGQTSVIWIVENTQTTTGAMEVTRSNGASNGGSEPLSVSVPIGKTLSDLTNASIFINSRSAGNGTLYPRPIAAAIITSTTNYELWRSDTGANLSYRTEIVEWPTATLTLRQNYYRFYTDNDALLPTDPWPAGGTDLGENTVLTGSDEPLGEGERIRIRLSMQVRNANLPEYAKSLTLQYGVRDTTCTAISPGNWFEVGVATSSTIWRGYNATGTTDGTSLSIDPPTGGDLLLSVSDVAGTLEEENDSIANPYGASEGDDVEYDWIIEQNGANAETFYCFRAVESNGTVLAYENYPQLRTASFSPKTQNWRWYDDEGSETPTVALAGETVAPIDVSASDTVKLRITVAETENIARDDVRFRLQYSEFPSFTVAHDVATTSSCVATSTWCYADGGGTDNAVISTTLLSDADTCIAGVGDGCGTHNESPGILTGFRHEASAATEYEFTIQASAAPRVNTVYYFRLFDISQGIPVVTNTGESYPSLVTEGAALTFNVSGLNVGSTTEGVTLDVGSTPTMIAYGSLPIDTEVEAAQRLSVNTNATEGYQVLMFFGQELMSSSGSTIDSVTGTNVMPTGWGTGCAGSATGCFGYHSGDDVLAGGSTRFAADDSYAEATTTPYEVAQHSLPVASDTVDVVYKVLVRDLQPAGLYESNVSYLVMPVF